MTIIVTPFANGAQHAAPLQEKQSAQGEWSPTLPCHTTGHAGPHPAVRRVELSMSREFGKPERGEVSVGQSDFQRWRVRKVPRSIGATRRFRGVLRSDAALAELPISRGSSFPLLPNHRPKSASEPFLQLVEHFRCFASSEVADPSAEIFR